MAYTQIEYTVAGAIARIDHAWPEIRNAESSVLLDEMDAAPPFAIKLTKRALNRTADIQGFRNALMAHFDTNQLSHVSQEFQAARDRGLASAIKAGR